jgi:hypothetical protein
VHEGELGGCFYDFEKTSSSPVMKIKKKIEGKVHEGASRILKNLITYEIFLV